MFTGIIESTGELISSTRQGSNLNLTIRSSVTSELKIDESISHNGVCLTVVEINGNNYVVTAVEETLNKSNLGSLKPGDKINLERSLKIGDRLDGHMVQGHVDTTGKLIEIENHSGSNILKIKFDKSFSKYIVRKGSICVNGISLTVVDVSADEFSVAIIPYTWENTNLSQLMIGDNINLEFDVIGKYVERMMSGANTQR